MNADLDETILDVVVREERNIECSEAEGYDAAVRESDFKSLKELAELIGWTDAQKKTLHRKIERRQEKLGFDLLHTQHAVRTRTAPGTGHLPRSHRARVVFPSQRALETQRPGKLWIYLPELRRHMPELFGGSLPPKVKLEQLAAEFRAAITEIKRQSAEILSNDEDYRASLLKLRREVESLRAENQRIRRRLSKLEETAKPRSGNSEASRDS